MIIDGVKMSSKDIEGTDLEATKIFCQKNKVRAATMIYIDKNGKVEVSGCYFNATGRNMISRFMRFADKYNEKH